MSEQEFNEELALEMRQEQEEIQQLENEYKTPTWDFLDNEEPKGFYTGYTGKTLANHAQDMRDIDFNI